VQHLFVYGKGFKLTNSSATIDVRNGAGTIDAVTYDSATKDWPLVANGKAMHLKIGALFASVNDKGGPWCIGTTTFGKGDVGTPGSGAHVCPADKDKDGILDAVDSCPDKADSGSDIDGDKVADACDNCKFAHNPDQKDSDKDGAGDACKAGICGNGVTEADKGEQCDDGNSKDGDGCSKACKKEQLGAKLNPGDLLITEFMPNPGGAVSDTNGEWLELYNNTKADIDLAGQTIATESKSGGSRKTMTFDAKTPVIVKSGAYFVISRSGVGKDNGWLPAGKVFSAMTLGNSGGRIFIESGSTVIDKVFYDDDGKNGWPTYSSNSVQLSTDKYTAAANDLGASWCKGVKAYDKVGTNKGTPGAANHVCM